MTTGRTGRVFFVAQSDQMIAAEFIVQPLNGETEQLAGLIAARCAPKHLLDEPLLDPRDFPLQVPTAVYPHTDSVVGCMGISKCPRSRFRQRPPQTRPMFSPIAPIRSQSGSFGFQ